MNFILVGNQLYNLNIVQNFYIYDKKIYVRLALGMMPNSDSSHYIEKPMTGNLTTTDLQIEWKKVLNSDPQYFVTLGTSKKLEKEVAELREMILCAPGFGDIYNAAKDDFNSHL